MLTLAGFMTLFGWIFIVTTLGVWFFKREVETQITCVAEKPLVGVFLSSPLFGYSALKLSLRHCAARWISWVCSGPTSAFGK